MVDTTTSSFSLLGDLSWLFTQVHFAALVVGIPLVLKVSCETPVEEYQGFEAMDRDGGSLDSIKRTVKNIFKSLGKPKVCSMLFVSLLICRYIPLDFTMESFFGLNKYYGYSATVKFTRLVAAFYFASYIYREYLPFMKESDSMTPPKQFFIAVSLGCLSYFLPVISVCVAALGELISFCWSKYNGNQPELVTIIKTDEQVTRPTMIIEHVTEPEVRPKADKPVTRPIVRSEWSRSAIEPTIYSYEPSDTLYGFDDKPKNTIHETSGSESDSHTHPSPKVIILGNEKNEKTDPKQTKKFSGSDSGSGSGSGSGTGSGSGSGQEFSNFV